MLADLQDDEVAADAKDTLIQLRAIVEGKLFDLPGGDARVAAGYEYMDDKLSKRQQSGIRIGTLGTFPFQKYGRNVHSFFGELVAPIIGDGDGGSMLTLSAQGRYDKYSDFGSTFNPKFGATFEPIKGFRFRGNWGTSFTAPTPLDQLGSSSSTVSGFPFVPFVRPGSTLLGGSNNTIAFQGSQPNLGPQEADTWSVGVDVNPTKGFRASMSYYNVAFSNVLGTPTANAGIFADFPGNVLYDVNGLTPAAITSFLTAGGTAPLTANQQAQLTNTLASLWRGPDRRSG